MDDSIENNGSLIDENLYSIDLSENEKNESSDKASSSKKASFKGRKIQNKLNKYEAILKKLEKINRVPLSQFLFVGNCGLENNTSCEFLEETFSKYGKLVDIVMPKKRSYAFIIYENETSTSQAITSLQSKLITCNQTPIYFYMFPVDSVPETSLQNQDYEEISDHPDGLVYLENYIDEAYANKIIEFIYKDSNNNNSEIKDLKKRKVKHYGYEFRYGSNDCDGAKKLNDPENRMPCELLDDLFKKMLNDSLIGTEPNQLTVNIYEPGNGIAPHIDNVNAFDDYIISLSLGSSVIMEFRQKETKRLSKIHLQPNSLIVLKKDSRYNWSHGIPERKHDLLKTSKAGKFLVEKREKRVSLTFRKLIDNSDVKQQQQSLDEENKKNDLVLPSTDQEARQFELSFVHNIYNEIADHFSHTRHSAWPGVAKFIDSMSPYSFMLDVGCGNGKYLNLRKDLVCFGCDYSDQLIRICYERNFNCFVSDILKIPCRNDYFDYIICIAVLHHLSTPARRINAITQICNCLKKGGQALITVWAKEQKYKEKESYYISKKGSGGGDQNEEDKPNVRKKENYSSNSEIKEKDPLIHNFGNEFEKKDLFVAWNYNPKIKSKKSTSKTEVISEQPLTKTETDENKPKQFLRFYHVFENNELEGLFEEIKNAKIVQSFYEQGNWCVIFEKV